MGVLTDVVVARTTDATEVCGDVNSDDFEWKEAPGLEIEMLVSLLCILEDKKGVSKRLAKEFPFLHENPMNGCSVSKISDTLVSHLAKLDARSLSKLADRWIETEEVQVQEVPLAIVKKRLVLLRDLSKIAISKKRSLLLRQTP